jgi:hypothetical protein
MVAVGTHSKNTSVSVPPHGGVAMGYPLQPFPGFVQLFPVASVTEPVGQV